MNISEIKYYLITLRRLEIRQLFWFILSVVKNLYYKLFFRRILFSYSKGNPFSNYNQSQMYNCLTKKASKYYHYRDRYQLISMIQDSDRQRIICEGEHLLKNSFLIKKNEYTQFNCEMEWLNINSHDKELLYTLNRFHFLNTLAFAYLLTQNTEYVKKGIELIKKWISINNYKYNDIAWDPMNVSERTINWLNFIFAVFDSKNINFEILSLIINNLYMQIRYLSSNIEYKANNNHLFFNARALIVFGYLFKEYKESSKWFKKGYRLFISELERQINEEGFHVEVSTGYHFWCVKVILEIYLFLGMNNIKSNGVGSTLNKMINNLMFMVRPDMTISHFGDFKDIDVQIEISELLTIWAVLRKRSDCLVFGKVLNERTVLFLGTVNCMALKRMVVSYPNSRKLFLRKTGYYIVKSSWERCGNYLMIDCGPFSGLPSNSGHGHADALSFELSLFGRPVFINAGTYTYEDSNLRNYFRGTLGHNTVIINDSDQSELWKSFRTVSFANSYLQEVRYDDKQQFFYFSGYHDGYRKDMNIIHKREVLVMNFNVILIKDIIYGNTNDIPVWQIFHLDNEIELIENDDEQILLGIGNNRFVKMMHFGNYADYDIVKGSEGSEVGWLSKTYLDKCKSLTIRYKLRSGTSKKMIVIIIPYEGQKPEVLLNKKDMQLTIVQGGLIKKIHISYGD